MGSRALREGATRGWGAGDQGSSCALTPGGARTFHLAVAAAAGGTCGLTERLERAAERGDPGPPIRWRAGFRGASSPRLAHRPRRREAGGRGASPAAPSGCVASRWVPPGGSRFSWRRMGEGVSSPSTGERAAHGSLSPSLSPEGLLRQGGPSISQRRERQAVSRSHEVSLFGTSVTPFPMSCSKLKKQTRFEVDFMRCLARKCDPASDPGRSVLNGTGRYAAKPL